MKLGKNWSPIAFGSDKDLGAVQIRQGRDDIVIPKSHLRRVIEKLETAERKLA